MEVKNLHFFDKSGYELNFNWIEILDNNNIDRGYWEGNIYLPKTSVGLYANTSIYVLEKVGNKFVFPKSDNIDSKKSKILFSWDILNKFVDEFFMFTFDSLSYINTDTSSLVYTENDGPDCEPVLITRFDTYEVYLENDETSKALPIHVAFTSPEKYDANTFKRTLVMEFNFKQIARINFFAETIEEDERLKILNSNLGYKLDKEDELIFKKSNIKEPKPDYKLLNEKRKELMINGHNIYPHIGSYKALINALKFFGYDNLNIIDIWKNVNNESDNFGKSYYVKKYTLSDGEVVYTNDYNIKLPSKDLKKSPNIALSYYINSPLIKNGEYKYDVFELPYTEEKWEYTLEEALIKLFALRDKLNKEFLPGRSRIIDIIGEANYFGLCGVTTNSKIGSTSLFKSGKNLSISAFPGKDIRITTDKLFNEYIYSKYIDGWNTSNKNLSSISENINSYSISDIEYNEEYENDIRAYVKSEEELCDSYEEFYTELNVNHTIEDDITDDLNDYFSKPFCFKCTYVNGDVLYEDIISDEKDDKIHNLNNLKELEITNRFNRYIGLDNVTTTFRNCKNLEKVIIYDGVYAINTRTFHGCNKLKEVLIPKSLEYIPSGCFYNCSTNNGSGVLNIKYTGSQEDWNSLTKKTYWNRNVPNVNITYNNSYDNHIISNVYNLSAKVILTNESLDEQTFENNTYTFENINSYNTFNNIDTSEYNEIEWSVSFSNNQLDDDLYNIGITKEFDKRTFNVSKSGLVNEYNKVMFELPYIGYYDVKISLKDSYNNISEKIFKKYIKVEPYNIDIRGFYYDAREIPKSVISDEDYRYMLFSSYDDSDSDSDSDYYYSYSNTNDEIYYENADDRAYITESNENFYKNMKDFILGKIRSMLNGAYIESASRVGDNSMTSYRINYESINLRLYMNENSNIGSYGDVVKIDIISYDEYNNKEYENIYTYDSFNEKNEYIIIENTYKKFYNNDSSYSIYIEATSSENNGIFDIETSVTYKYISFNSDNTIILNNDSSSYKVLRTTHVNPVLTSDFTLNQNTRIDEDNPYETINKGPYILDEIYNEWQMSDNINPFITTLQPDINYIRYIKNGVDVKPYTWLTLGFEHSLIKGKYNPEWTLINLTENKTFNNLDYLYDEISEIEYQKKTFDEKEELKKQLPTHKGKYFTYLLKDEGKYKIILNLDDVNGNHYSIERNLFVVSKDANHKLYTPFITDYTDYLKSKELYELGDWNIMNPTNNVPAQDNQDISDIIGYVSNNNIVIYTDDLQSGNYTVSYVDEDDNELESWTNISKFTI